MTRARLEFMRFHPVLAALDADQNGEISAKKSSALPLRWPLSTGMATVNLLRMNFFQIL